MWDGIDTVYLVRVEEVGSPVQRVGRGMEVREAVGVKTTEDITGLGVGDGVQKGKEVGDKGASPLSGVV